MSTSSRLDSVFEIVERDEAGSTTCSYIFSPIRPALTTQHETSQQEIKSENVELRLDKVKPRGTKSFFQKALDVFLPVGHVTEDYISYQIYDSLQAFFSSIAGLLASRAVLEGVGVGDASASPTAALLLSTLQESTGRIATIVFAHRLGTTLEPECKSYRLLADIFNDLAMLLDCLSPVFPKPARVAVLCFSSSLRALCGVCAGSTKASLSRHFATKGGNLGEISAKDSSQETVISLLGMLAGSLVISWVITPVATWTTLIALLGLHLAANYLAVTSVSLDTLNRQRANIMLSTFIQNRTVLTPSQVSKRERVFERDGVLRWADDTILGYARIGVELDELLKRLKPTTLSGTTGDRSAQGGPWRLRTDDLTSLMRVFEQEGYMLWFADGESVIVLKEGCTPLDQVKAWGHALLLAERLRSAKTVQCQSNNDTLLAAEDRLVQVKMCLEEMTSLLDAYGERMRRAGWDLDTAAVETRAGRRVVLGGVRKRAD